jgi:hypothetical protein
VVSDQEVAELRDALNRGEPPEDFASKLDQLSGEDLSRRFIEQNCRLFVALLQAAQERRFREVSVAECERLIRVLAYVRKDDDCIPDYSPRGFSDDQQEIRAAVTELAPTLERFKAWRLRHQVPQLWHVHEPARVRWFKVA